MADVKNVDATTFEAEVLQSDIPVLVDFWAPWCAPCQMVAPIVEKVAEGFAGRAKVVKVNVDEAPELANQYGIRGIPSLLVFKGGDVVSRLVGVQPEPVLRSALEAAL
ncbi:MAG: thioredoxin [Armatimonadetes bacterium]|nr:thioredoxin [Armatimonadota bacterium]